MVNGTPGKWGVTEDDHEKNLDIFITLCKANGIILSKKKEDIKKNEI